MTSAPMDVVAPPAAPVPGGPGAPAAPGSGVDALAFATLVDQAIAVAATAPGQPSRLATDAEQDPQADASEAPTEESGAPSGAEASLVALLLALAAPTTPGLARAGSAQAGPIDTSPATPAGIPAGAPGTTPALPAAVAPGAPAAQDTPDPAAAPPVPPASDDAPQVPSPAATAHEPAEQSTARPVDPGTVPVVASGPVTVAGGSGAGQVQLGDAQPARSVAAQVIPEITRLVSDGEGVHRVTLQLNPRALGEVRVVLTMRQGEVHVRIAGGEEARQAVAASSAELTRALHHIGIDEHRLTLTDLPATAATRSSTGSDLHDQTRQHQHPTGGNDPHPHGQNSHSWMGDARSATDGSSTSTPTDRMRGSARVHEADPTRSAGEVDLRM